MAALTEDPELSDLAERAATASELSTAIIGMEATDECRIVMKLVQLLTCDGDRA